MIIDYSKISEAQKLYAAYLFVDVDAPWAVDETAWKITSPKHSKPYLIEGNRLVASGEQSFLHLIANAGLPPGKYQCVTPCFRDEAILTQWNRRYFLKCELIDTQNTSDYGLDWVVSLAHHFFTRYIDCEIVQTDQNKTDPLSVSETFDIVSTKGKIELGSYGIREHPKVGRWVYGTGCAEPRLSQAIEATRLP